jgi:cation diffusion facilitator family transporter
VTGHVSNIRRLAKRGMRSSLLGMFVNLLLASAKCIAGLVGHSFALVADGLESFSDVLSGLAIYLGLKIAVRPPDEDHPYGHGKAEPFAALVVGLFLIGAALVIIAESVHQIRTPHPLPAPYTLVVLAGVLVVKGLMTRYVGRVGSEIHSTAVRADAIHHFSDATVSAFAVVGISVAILTREPTADDWAALCASLVIVYNAWRQMRPAILELGDRAPDDPGLQVAVRRIAESVKGVMGVDKCQIRKMGLSFYIDLHVVVKGSLSVREGHQIAHAVENAVMKKMHQVEEVLVHIEPEEELAKNVNTGT